MLPENGRTVDFALKYGVKKEHFCLELRSGAYFSKVKNWIQWMPTSYRYWVPENVSLVYARGIENHVDMSFSLGNWKANRDSLRDTNTGRLTMDCDSCGYNQP